VIVQPSTPRIVETIIEGLESSVVPEVHEAPAQLAIGMALQVLRTTAMRSGNEVAWMREECDAVEALATHLIADLPVHSGALRTALDAYTRQKTGSLYLAIAQLDYERAGEVLSCAAELAYAHGGDEHRVAIHRLFEQRLAHENAITGGYQAVGRS
jgi:hypothetical protein